MGSCLLCLEINSNKLNCIRTDSKSWLELNIANTVEKHFWPLSTIRFDSFICSPCWRLVDDFHQFYLRVEEAHMKLVVKVEKEDVSDFCFQKPSTDRSEGVPTDVNIKNEPLDLDDDMESISNVSKDNFSPQTVGNVNVGKCKKRKSTLEKSLEIKKKSGDLNDDSESASDIDEDNSDGDYQPDSNSSDNYPINADRNRASVIENDKLILDYMKQINCSICKIQLENFSAMCDHFLESHQQKGYILCCNRQFFRQKDLADHIHCHLNPNYFRCAQCGKMFSSRLLLEQHECEHGSEEVINVYSCEVCSKVFLNVRSLKIHKLSHLPGTEPNNSRKDGYKMANFGKMNPKQKELMAEFMNEHRDLAQNLIPNSVQGKLTTNRLWDELIKRLNAVGPPVKNVKLWKKVFSDQKYQVKKKLSFNKLSKERAGGGPYEEKLLTLDEELLMEAAGLAASIEDTPLAAIFPNTEVLNADSHCGDSIESIGDIDEPYSSTKLLESKAKRVKTEISGDQKLVLLEKNIKASTDFHTRLEAKLDRLLEIQEKLLQLQEKRHNVYMKIAELDMKIKRKQLDVL